LLISKRKKSQNFNPGEKKLQRIAKKRKLILNLKEVQKTQNKLPRSGFVHLTAIQTYFPNHKAKPPNRPDRPLRQSISKVKVWEELLMRDF
jgi:hypothetical protein